MTEDVVMEQIPFTLFFSLHILILCSIQKKKVHPQLFPLFRRNELSYIITTDNYSVKQYYQTWYTLSCEKYKKRLSLEKHTDNPEDKSTQNIIFSTFKTTHF